MTADPGTFEQVWAGFLHDAFTLDGEEVWTGEDGGRIRHRDPQTDSWSFQSVPFEVRGAIRRLHFLTNGLTGWAVSTDGWVLKTTSGGLTWGALARIPAQPATLHLTGAQWEDLFDVWFAENGTDGWLIGQRGILRTTDGGVCWSACNLYNKTGGAAGSTDWYATWEAELYALDVRMGVPQDVCTGDPSTTNFLGLVVGRPGVIFRSLDGLNWRIVFDWQDMCALSSGCLAAPCAPGDWWDFWDVELGVLSSDGLALVVGGVGTGCGLALASTDGGCTFVRELHECEHPSSGVDCDCTTSNCDPRYDPDAVPRRHVDLRTLYGVGIFEDGTAIAAGYNGQHLRRELLTDGTGVVTGGVWRDRSDFGEWTDAPLTAIIFPMFGATVPRYPIQPGRAWMTGVGGHLRISDDFGESWDHELLGEPFRTTVVWFKSVPNEEDSGWQAGQYFRLARSLDSGKSWTQAGPPRTFPQGAELFDLCFAGDGLRGVTVGNKIPGVGGSPPEGPRILYSEDFGADGWREPASITYLSGEEPLHLETTLRAVRWAKDGNNLHFWTAGHKGLVLRTTDGGEHWTQIALPVVDPHQHLLQGVAASSANAIVVVGGRNFQGTTEARVFSFVNLVGSEIPIQSTLPGTIELLTDVAVQGSLMYAVGQRRHADGTRTGVVLKYDPGAQPAPAFVDFSGPRAPNEVESCPNSGGGALVNQVLTAVEVLSNGDLWIAGVCGKVWQRIAATSQWKEHKSQTDADIRKMMFLSPQRGYFAALGGPGTNQVILRYQAQ